VYKRQQQTCYSNFDGPAQNDDIPKQIIIRGAYIWVCGYSEGQNNNQKDLTLVSYDICGPVGISDPASQITSNVYPNPFTDVCRISVNAAGENATFQLFDMVGKAVTQQTAIKGNEYILNKGSLAKGIYQYKISTNKSGFNTGTIIVN
jgi:hypothetical protein